ncbi:MAG TPA: hypothetical protein VNG90_05340 [Candidatus Acidoferrum sp.]|nr:hypothetical protein [Candidatus Acidoferrum sp.]
MSSYRVIGANGSQEEYTGSIAQFKREQDEARNAPETFIFSTRDWVKPAWEPVDEGVKPYAHVLGRIKKGVAFLDGATADGGPSGYIPMENMYFVNFYEYGNPSWHPESNLECANPEGQPCGDAAWVAKDAADAADKAAAELLLKVIAEVASKGANYQLRDFRHDGQYYVLGHSNIYRDFIASHTGVALLEAYRSGLLAAWAAEAEKYK